MVEEKNHIENIELIKKLWLEGKKDSEIAEILGLTKEKVKYIRRKLGYFKKRKTIDVELLKKLWFEKTSLKEIADILGFKKTSILAAARRLGLPNRSTLNKAEIRRKLIDSYKNEIYQKIKDEGVFWGRFRKIHMMLALKELVNEGKVRSAYFRRVKMGLSARKYKIPTLFPSTKVYWVDDDIFVRTVVLTILDKLPKRVFNPVEIQYLSKSLTHMLNTSTLPTELKNRISEMFRKELRLWNQK